MATTPAEVTVIGGVDTHKHTHYAALIDDRGRLPDHREFAATDAGYAERRLAVEHLAGNSDRAVRGY